MSRKPKRRAVHPKKRFKLVPGIGLATLASWRVSFARQAVTLRY